MKSDKLIIYHGSSQIIEKPTYGLGNKDNDYGLGFYCTENIELAREWACSDKENSWCNRYALSTDGLKILNLTSDEYNELQWLALLMDNRDVRMGNTQIESAAKWLVDNYLIDISGYDVIIGYRADDSFFSIVRSFVNGTLPIELLKKSLERGVLGEQVVLKSKKAFEQIKFEKVEAVDHRTYYPRRVSRSTRASEEFSNQDISTIKNGTFINDLIRKGGK